MDLFAKIKEEHRIILGTLADLVGSDPGARRERLDDLIVQIYMHMNAEEQSIYSAFEKLDAVPRSLALRNEQEHHVGRLLMNEIQDRVMDEEIWEAKLAVLRFVLEHHVDLEETQMFDVALDYFDQSEVEAMAKRFQEVEEGLFRESRVGAMRRA
jgi:hemerythrin-like domain-containing protein